MVFNVNIQIFQTLMKKKIPFHYQRAEDRKNRLRNKQFQCQNSDFLKFDLKKSGAILEE